MASRPVPRNIDRANRNAEFVMTFLVVYYSIMFLFHEPLMALVFGMFGVYFVNKLTMDKPEGQAYRFIYRYIRIGHVMPSPRFVKKLEM